MACWHKTNNAEKTAMSLERIMCGTFGYELDATKMKKKKTDRMVLSITCG